VDTNPGAGVTDEATVNIAEFLAGEPAPLSEYARSIEGSTILQIAADIREMLERGERVLNLTVGDFRPDQFPIPARLADFCVEAMREGQTNYPPVPGVMELREAVQELTREELGLNYPIDGILVGGGARPILYASYMALVDPGETVLYPVPSWNNHHYCRLARATGIPLPVTAEKNFHLDRADLEPYLKTARLLAMNSPLNPTGTCISRDALFEICEAIVAENERRRTAGERPLFLIYDQVYNSLTFGDARHWTPMELVPEIAPYTIAMDAVSKRFSGTGIRVGWGIGPPAILKKMSQMAGHYGAWAPRPEQVGTARFLRERESVLAHRSHMRNELHARLSLLDEGFTAMRAAGLPIEHIAPQGAIYLSVRFDLIGKTVADKRLLTNEDIRSLLLSEAGFAVVPFEAFGLEGNSGWMRLSVGAVSVDEVRGGLDRVKALMETRT
jgi:aspartate aminotransferase